MNDVAEPLPRLKLPKSPHELDWSHFFQGLIKEVTCVTAHEVIGERLKDYLDDCAKNLQDRTQITRRVVDSLEGFFNHRVERRILEGWVSSANPD